MTRQFDVTRYGGVASLLYEVLTLPVTLMIAWRRSFIEASIFILPFIVTTQAASLLPQARTPEDAGMSSAQLGRLEEATRAHIEAGSVPGAVMVVVRDGKIAWQRVLGFRDRATNDPMKADSLFRISAMTKPIICVAAMMLIEDGKMQLRDPVAKFIPEFQHTKVGVEKTGSDGRPVLELTEPAQAMTIKDLFLNTSGLTYGARGKSLVHMAHREAKIFAGSENSEDFARRVAALPLRFAPGTQWDYGVSTDILARVVEVVSGMSLGDFLDARILKPLGMLDTAFLLSPDKVVRAAQPAPSPDGRPMTPRRDVALKPRVESAGGLISSAEDYLRFASMLLNGGSLDGKRFLSKETIDLIFADHVSGLPGVSPTFGSGMGLQITKSKESGAADLAMDYGWRGNTGTIFMIDPTNKLIALYMVQVNDYDRVMLTNQFRDMVRAAILR